MKKSVYIPGIASTTLMLFGCMFKIMHWPGANILLILSVFLFCFYFLPMALITNYKSQETPKHRSLHVITFIVFFICVMGVLFKVMHWPGASMFLIIGLPLPFVLFLPAYLYSTRNEKKENNINFLGLMFGLTFLAVFSVLLALSISKQVLRNAVTRVYSIEKTRSFSEAVLANTKKESHIKQKADDLCNFIEQIKDVILGETQGYEFGEKRPEPKYNWEMQHVEDKQIPTNVLFALEKKTKFDELKEKVNDYKTALLETPNLDPQLAELSKDLFNINATRELSRSGHIEELSWEQREFSNKQLIFVLGALSQIQSNVRIVELEYLASVK
jgi:hypothetical protein